MVNMSYDINTLSRELINAGKMLDSLNMVPATSGNFSARLDEKNILVTASGRHKGKLNEDDFLVLDLNGNTNSEKKPSAEKDLHLQLYAMYPKVNCILHPHSRHATRTRHLAANEILLENYELLKAFEGISTHETSLSVPVFENDQNIPELGKLTSSYLADNPGTKAYIIRGHGFYTWGSSVTTALRHCEALEFLLQCEFDAGKLR